MPEAIPMGAELKRPISRTQFFDLLIVSRTEIISVLKLKEKTTIPKLPNNECRLGLIDVTHQILNIHGRLLQPLNSVIFRELHPNAMCARSSAG